CAAGGRPRGAGGGGAAHRIDPYRGNYASAEYSRGTEQPRPGPAAEPAGGGDRWRIPRHRTRPALGAAGAVVQRLWSHRDDGDDDAERPTVSGRPGSDRAGIAGCARGATGYP